MTGPNRFNMQELIVQYQPIWGNFTSRFFWLAREAIIGQKTHSLADLPGSLCDEGWERGRTPNWKVCVVLELSYAWEAQFIASTGSPFFIGNINTPSSS
jgi:hypothetical protein